MGYVLLWIEHLAVGLLLVATLVACISRLQRPRLRLVLALLVAIVPLIVYGVITAGLGYFRFKEMILMPLLYPMALMTVCFGVGVIWIVRAALRRRDNDSPAAANWPRGKLALMMFVVFGLHMMTWWNQDQAVKQQMANLDAEAAAMMLSIAPARLPDRDNAALIYEQTYEALSPDSWSEARRNKWKEWTKEDSPVFDPNDPAFKSLLDDQAATLMLLRQGGQKPGCHIGREYNRLSWAMEMPELGKLMDAARLLSLNARYRSAQGDMQTALADVGTIFAIAEHVSPDPLLVSALVAARIDSIATKTFEDVLAVEGMLDADERITTEQLQAIDLDGSLSFQRLFRRSLQAEMAGSLRSFQQISCGGLGEAEFSIRGAGMQTLYRMFMVRSDVMSYRKSIEEFLRIAAKPYHESASELHEFDANLASKPRGFVTRWIMPEMWNVGWMSALAEARHHTARIALAAARYRAEKGELPKDLDALVPAYIPILPRDPFDGKPMKYRITDDGAVIYSIGPDDKDDNGTSLEEDDEGNKVGDVTFTFKRGRRLPAK